MRLYSNIILIQSSVSKKLPIIVSLVILLLIAAVSVYFRVNMSPHLGGGYFLGSHSYRHVHYIRQIVSDGELAEIDLMRGVPDGVKTTLHTIGLPWVLAQGFNILRQFLPELSLNQTMALYPVVAVILSSIVLFLIANKHFGFLTSCLAVLAFSTAPTTINKTQVGHVDVDSLVLFLFLLTFFFYSLSLEPSTIFKQAACKLISAAILGLTGVLWFEVGLIAGIIYGCDVLIGIHRGFDKKQAFVSLCGICLYFGLLLFPGSAYYGKLLEPFTLLAIFPALLASSFYVLALIRPIKLQFSKHINQVFNKKGLIVVGVLCAFSIYWMRGTVVTICERLLFHGGTDPIIKAIGEIQPADWNWWWTEYGLFCLAGLIGLFFVVKKNCITERGFKRPHFHLVGLVLTLVCVVLPRAFTPFFLRLPPTVGLIVLIIPVGWAILYISFLMLRNRSEKTVPFIIWFLVSLSFASSATGLALFFTPIFVLLGSLCFAQAIEYFIPYLRKNIGLASLFVLNLIVWLLFFCGFDIFTSIRNIFGWGIQVSTNLIFLVTLVFSLISVGFILEKSMTTVNASIAIKRFIGFLVVCILCFSTYTGVYGLGIGRQGFITAKSLIPRVENFAHQIRESTPEDAVIAGDWNYGSIINEIARRATIIDEEQSIDKIRDFYKKVILGETTAEMLDFLRDYDVTHLMFTVDDVVRVGDYWAMVQPNHPLDTPWVIKLKRVTDDTTVQRIEYLPVAETVQIINNSSALREKLSISKVVVDLDVAAGGITISRPPQVIVSTERASERLSIREVISGRKHWYFPEAALPVTLWMDVSELGIHKTFLLTQTAGELNIVRLFSGEHSGLFEEVIREANDFAKVWKVLYP